MSALSKSDAGIVLIDAIAHLHLLAAMAQTKPQQETALRLAVGLASVLPLVGHETPSKSKTSEPAQPSVDAPTTEWFVYYRQMIAYLLQELPRLRGIEAAALRVASSRRDGIVKDQAPLDALDQALEARS